MQYIYSFLLIFISNNLVGQVITKKLESEIKRRVELEINPSFAIGILLPDETTKFYGYGYFSNSYKQPDSLTLYEIGSITKTFTAYLAGTYLKGSLNKPVSTFFTKVKNSKLDSITPYELLNHTAGVPRLSNQFSPQNWSNPFNGYSIDILHEELKGLNPDTTKTWSYSNFGYGILGRAIEIVSGKPYASLMGDFLEDIGMENTLLLVPAKKNQKIAQPTNVGSSSSNWNFTGPSRYAGGLVSNTKDLIGYLRYQKQNNPLFITNTLQKPIQTRVPNLGKDRLFYKDGWFVLKPDSITDILLHNGGTGGYISFIGFNKTTSIGVVILSNSINVVDDIGINILYPKFKLNHPKRTIAYELAKEINNESIDSLVYKYETLKSIDYPDNIIDVYWLERFHFGKGNYSISNQLSDIMVKELPEDWEVYDIKGQNFEQLKDLKKAITSYKKALELNPKNRLLTEKIKRCTTLHERNMNTN